MYYIQNLMYNLHSTLLILNVKVCKYKFLYIKQFVLITQRTYKTVQFVILTTPNTCRSLYMRFCGNL